MNNPYAWLQDVIGQIPEFLQPLIVALAGTVPYIEGEGAAGLGIVAGINPIVAAIAGASGNILCVVAVVTLSSRIRAGVLTRKGLKVRADALQPEETATTLVGAQSVVTAPLAKSAVSSSLESPVSTRADLPEVQTSDPDQKASRKTKGQAKLRRWLVKFGVPGASILAPMALPTMLTAAFFVASGIPKQWVILWQVVAIVLWTTVIAVAAASLKAAVGW